MYPAVWLLKEKNTSTKKWKNAGALWANLTASGWHTNVPSKVQNAHTLLLGIFAFNMIQINDSLHFSE